MNSLSNCTFNGKKYSYKTLENKVAVVTGSASGIGRCCAIRLAQEGAKIIVSDINKKEGEETVDIIKKLGQSAFFQHTDATKEDSIKECIDNAIKCFGRIDILVNNAVQFRFGHLHPEGEGSGTLTDKNPSKLDWDAVLNTNVIGYANFIKHAVKYMVKNELSEIIYTQDWGEGKSTINAGFRGSIVNICSVSSYIAQNEFIPYNASKAATLSITKCCAKDLSKYKIRVNAVCPGTIETKGSYNHMKKINISVEEGRKLFSSYNELKRQGAPEEIANVVNFLAGKESSFMTGSHIIADAGETI